MINCLIYLPYAPCCSQSATLSKKKDVEYANSDIGMALKSTRLFYLVGGKQFYNSSLQKRRKETYHV